eukprot:SAG31_NODE_6695_length_1922_cov_1.754800_1_plen_214_part_00
MVVNFKILVPLSSTNFANAASTIYEAFYDQSIAGVNVLNFTYPTDLAETVQPACSNGWFIGTGNGADVDECLPCSPVDNATETSCTQLGDTTALSCQPGYTVLSVSGGMDSCVETLCKNDEYVLNHTCVPCCDDMSTCNATNYKGDRAGQGNTRCLSKCTIELPDNAVLGECPEFLITGRTCNLDCEQGYSIQTIKKVRFSLAESASIVVFVK